MSENKIISKIVVDTSLIASCLSCRKLVPVGTPCFAFRNIKNLALLQKWRLFAELPDSYDLKPKDCLCIEHFRADQIDILEGKRRLRPGSIPIIKKNPPVVKTHQIFTKPQTIVEPPTQQKDPLLVKETDVIQEIETITSQQIDRINLSESSEEDSNESDEESLKPIKMEKRRYGGKRKCVICDRWLLKGESGFKFPYKRPRDCQVWMKFARLPKNHELKHAECLCSKHFASEEFSDTSAHGNSKRRSRLIVGALPTIFDPRGRFQANQMREALRSFVPKVFAPSESDAKNIKKFLSTVKRTSLQRVDLNNMNEPSDVKCCVCIENFVNDVDLTKRSPYSGRKLSDILGESLNLLVMISDI